MPTQQSIVQDMKDTSWTFADLAKHLRQIKNRAEKSPRLVRDALLAFFHERIDKIDSWQSVIAREELWRVLLELCRREPTLSSSKAQLLYEVGVNHFPRLKVDSHFIGREKDAFYFVLMASVNRELSKLSAAYLNPLFTVPPPVPIDEFLALGPLEVDWLIPPGCDNNNATRLGNALDRGFRGYHRYDAPIPELANVGKIIRAYRPADFSRLTKVGRAGLRVFETTIRQYPGLKLGMTEKGLERVVRKNLNK